MTDKVTPRSRTSAAAREDDRRRWRAFLRPQWAKVAAVLSHTEERVLSLRLGLTNDAACSHEVIARRLGLSQGSINQIEARARRKVKAALKVEGNP